VADEERGSLLVRVTERATGAVSSVALPAALFSSQAFANLQRVHGRLRELAGSPPFEVVGKKAALAPTFETLRAQILRIAQEGLDMGRFKGLGEMNPDQLRETTMDPHTRTLQQVTMEDAQAADELFTLLMGDVVAPRRDFIESNARDVTNLDV
jgi:DNA gyrase subunit B